MATKSTGKQRAQRIPLEYYKRSDALGRWKLGLALLAPAVALGWWFGGDVARPGQRALRVSHGPVAAVHATWEHQCEACHVPFRPIGAETWPEPYLKRFGIAFTTTDTKCQACHAGPPHHAAQITKDVPSCAACHRDHRGRDASLVRSPDSDCTSCHADLKAHIQPEKPLVYGDVTSFPQQHPEFAALHIPGAEEPSPRVGDAGLEDPSALKFNHELHMTPGMGQDYTLAQILDEEQRARYRGPGQGDATAVQLECASCHTMDPGDLRGASAAAPTPGRGAPGAYMMPIVYENQCRACHPLDVSRPGAGRQAPAEGQPEGEEPGGATPLPTLPVPHGVQPPELHDFLANAVAAQVLSSTPDLERRRRLPGPTGVDAATVRQAIDEGVMQAEEVLYKGTQTCTECHHYTPLKAGEAIEVKRGEPPNFRVDPPRVPDVWFPSAVFNHAAHRAVDCRQCHAKAYPTLADGSPNREVAATSEAVMLPGIETCRKCHAPTSVAAGKVLGGARFDCVECHRYHNGDQPRQGAGARAQDARVQATIAEFLNHAGPFEKAGTAPAPAPSPDAKKAAAPPPGPQ